MNVIDESYRVGMMLARTHEGQKYIEQTEVAKQRLEEIFEEIGVSLVNAKNSFFEYVALDESLKYQMKLPEEERVTFLAKENIEKLLSDKEWQNAIAYMKEFAINVEKMIQQIQYRKNFKDITGFTMTSKLRNAGTGLETAYQRTGIYDLDLITKIAKDQSYGCQLDEYERRRQYIGGNVSHYAYCREVRRILRQLEQEGYSKELLHMSENMYLLKDLMEEAIWESFSGGRITVETQNVRKVRRKDIGNGFEIIALWTDLVPELTLPKGRFIYDVILDNQRYNCAMKNIKHQWFPNEEEKNYIRMIGLLYPQNDVGVFKI